MTKKKNDKPITIILALILLAVLGVSFYLTIPFIKNTDIYKNYQANRLATYTSTRAKFSFKYPNNWPISTIPEEELKSDNQWRDDLKKKGIEKNISIRIDNIDFQEEWFPNADGPRYGWIDIRRKDGINSLDDYIQTINKDSQLYLTGKGHYVTIPAPEITFTIIGRERAISVKDKVGGTFSKNLAEYVVVKNGWVYRFAAVDSSRFLENKEANLAKFQKLIESVRFLN